MNYVCLDIGDIGQGVFLPAVTPWHRRITMARIRREVELYYGIRKGGLGERIRRREIARPRQIAFYFCREMTTQSYPDIARNFGGFDHTTVIHGVREIERLIACNNEVATDVEALRERLTA